MPDNASTNYGSTSLDLVAIHRLLAALRWPKFQSARRAEPAQLHYACSRDTARSAPLTDNATTDSLATGAWPLAESGFFDHQISRTRYLGYTTLASCHTSQSRISHWKPLGNQCFLTCIVTVFLSKTWHIWPPKPNSFLSSIGRSTCSSVFF